MIAIPNPVFILAAVCGLWLGTPPLRADYTSDFNKPPYAANQSVIGRNGWDYRLPTTEDRSDTARVVVVRWNAYKPAMVLKGANLKNIIAPPAGEKVTI